MKIKQYLIHMSIVICCISLTIMPLYANDKEDLYTASNDTLVNKDELLGEVIIKAERRVLQPLNTPASISVITPKLLSRQTITDIRDVASFVPNFYMQESGLKLSTPIYVRGVGSVSGTPSIGLYVDGTPIFDKNAFVFDLYDIAQIDFFKGPQSTLYGRNSINGLVNIQTIAPNLQQQELDVLLGLANYKSQKGKISLSSPIGEHFAHRLSFNYNKSDGYFTNIYNNSEPGSTRNYSLRYNAIYNTANGTNWALGAEYNKTKDGGYAYHAIDSLKEHHYDVNYNSPASYKRDLIRVHLNTEKSMDKVSISNVVAYAYSKDKQVVDADYTFYDVFENSKKSSGYHIAEEFNIRSLDNRNIKWNAGAFGFYKHLNNDYNAKFGTDKALLMPLDLDNALYTNRIRNYGVAAYAQISATDFLWRNFTASVGVRYEYEHVSLKYHDDIYTLGSWIYNWHQTSEKSDYGKLLPKISLLQRFDNSSVYLTISEGYKAGGYNIIANEMSSRITDLKYKEEHLWNYELGYKYQAPSGVFSCNISTFFIDWRKQQIFVMGMMGPNITNAGDAHNYGLDGDIALKLLSKYSKSGHHTLMYNLAAGYTHATYYNNNVKENVGNHIVMAPQYTLNSGLSYTYNITNAGAALSINSWVNSLGKQYFDEANTLEQNGYFLWNTEACFSVKNIKLSVWCKNILNKHYLCYEFKSPVGKNKPEYLNSGQSGAPRTGGISIEINLTNKK